VGGEQGEGGEFHNAVFRAYYVGGINIAKPDELIVLAEIGYRIEEGLMSSFLNH